MTINGVGWGIHITRQREDRWGHRRRTVGTYRVYHDGAPVAHLAGSCAETRGPGDNSRENNGRRVEPGRYPLLTQNGRKYRTIGYADNLNHTALPRPGIELGQTGRRTEILIHPARGFLWSVGCINPSNPLPDGNSVIDFSDSRRRTVALIDDMAAYIGARFPERNGRRIANAWAVIEGEP